MRERHGGLFGRHFGLGGCRRRPFVEVSFGDCPGPFAEDFEGLADEVERSGDDDEGIGRAASEGLGDGLGDADGTRDPGGKAGGLEVVGRNGPGTGDAGGEDTGGERSQGAGHVAPFLVGEHAEDEDGGAIGEMPFEGGAERCDAIAVVGAVEQEGLFSALEDLKSAGPTDTGESPRHLLVGDGKQEAQDPYGRGREGGVGALVFPEQRQVVSELFHGERADGDEGTSGFPGLELEDGKGVRVRGGGERRNVGLEDTGLLGGDGSDRRAEDGHVVESDLGDDRGQRRDDVGGVVPSAEAGLPCDEVDLGFGEPEQGEDGGELEEGGFQLRRSRLHGGAKLGRQAGEGFVGNGSSIDADAFVESDEVGGGVEADATAGGAMDGVQHGADRAFAIGAGDVDEAEGFVGIADQAGEMARGLQSGLEAELLEREQVGQCLGVGHGPRRIPRGET